MNVSTAVRLISLLLCALLANAADDTAKVSGRVVDDTGAPLPGSFIRLIPKDTSMTAYKIKAGQENALFGGEVAPGIYSVAAWTEGFRERLVKDIAILPGKTTDLGTISLDMGGCDAPGVSCTGDPVMGRVHSSNFVTLRQSCGYDFDASKLTCPEPGKKMGKGPRHDVDVWFVNQSNGVFLMPGDGASISSLQPGGGCTDAKYGAEPVRVDGLGPGNDVCIRTSDKHVSHIFINEDVTPQSLLKLWHVTR